jgi:uncharacterized protein YjaZ
MSLTKIKFCLVIVLILLGFADSFAQEKVVSKKNQDPDKAALITSDIDNFWRAYDLAAQESAPEKKREIFQREYFDKASVGLKFFAAAKIGKLDALLSTLNQRPLYYASIRQASLKVNSLSGKIRKSLRNLKSLYPEANFPDVYFVIGRMSSAGTASDKALIIGVDMFGKTKDYPTTELTDWHKQVLMPLEKLPAIVAHEIIHFQQSYRFGENKLLAQAITEGAADFIGDKIAGQMINSHLHEYGNPLEEKLWEEFEEDMQSNDSSKWLYNGTRAKNRPADLGYYIGYKICESYAKQIKNQQQAIKDILHIKDFYQFLLDSKYKEKFAKK